MADGGRCVTAGGVFPRCDVCSRLVRVGGTGDGGFYVQGAYQRHCHLMGSGEQVSLLGP